MILPTLQSLLLPDSMKNTWEMIIQNEPVNDDLAAEDKVIASVYVNKEASTAMGTSEDNYL
jgi:hypothetical protein